MQTRNQRYAAQIFRQVSPLAEQPNIYPDAYRKKYGAMAHKLPILIRTAGLAQSLAFVEARAKSQTMPDKPVDAHLLLLDHLATVIGFDTRGAFVQHSRDADLSEYIHLTQKVTAALLWYKRFAQSVLKVEPGQEGEER